MTEPRAYGFQNNPIVGVTGDNMECMNVLNISQVTKHTKTYICSHPTCYSVVMVEKFNSTLINSLKAFMDDNRTNWDDMAEYIASAYRGTEHASTHISPYVMLYGQDKIMAQVY